MIKRERDREIKYMSSYFINYIRQNLYKQIFYIIHIRDKF